MVHCSGRWGGRFGTAHLQGVMTQLVEQHIMQHEITQEARWPTHHGQAGAPIHAHTGAGQLQTLLLGIRQQSAQHPG
jgi:hypothetical protein